MSESETVHEFDILLVFRDGSHGRVLGDRAAGGVLGWRPACTCRTTRPDGSVEVDHWEGGLMARACSREDEDPARGRFFVLDADVEVVDALPGLCDELRRRWHEHVQHAASLSMIRWATDELEALTRDLADAVTLAREAGHSWAKIGAAARMSRQSAYARWSKTMSPAD